MSEAPFPPTDWCHIEAYDNSEVVEGYLAFDAADPMPGGNHSPAYRWGWQNRKRDGEHEDDGFDAIRHAYFAESPKFAASRRAIGNTSKPRTASRRGWTRMRG